LHFCIVGVDDVALIEFSFDLPICTDDGINTDSPSSKHHMNI
jgi:hypothetical protein